MNEICKMMLKINLKNIPDSIILEEGQISPKGSFDIDSPKANFNTNSVKTKPTSPKSISTPILVKRKQEPIIDIDSIQKKLKF